MVLVPGPWILPCWVILVLQPLDPSLSGESVQDEISCRRRTSLRHRVLSVRFVSCGWNRARSEHTSPRATGRSPGKARVKLLIKRQHQMGEKRQKKSREVPRGPKVLETPDRKQRTRAPESQKFFEHILGNGSAKAEVPKVRTPETWGGLRHLMEFGSLGCEPF